ncbi:MAG: helix-turn-helix transcriptional regulator [Blautia wexlerae]
MSNRAISTELIELGERIRKRRQEMKLSQESFAEKAGISVNTVSRIEGGQTAMSVEIFRKMIEILETDANILMGKEGDDAEKRKQFEEVFYLIQKMEWKEQKIIMQTIDSLIESFNEYR